MPLRGIMKHENSPQQQVEDSGVPNLFGLFSEQGRGRGLAQRIQLIGQLLPRTG
jgi:hypothetical protein